MFRQRWPPAALAKPSPSSMRRCPILWRGAFHRLPRRMEISISPRSTPGATPPTPPSSPAAASRALGRAAGARQCPDRAPVAEVGAVRVHVLAEQRALQDAVRAERAHLREDVARPPVALLAAQRRDDAERARVVAADRDGDP